MANEKVSQMVSLAAAEVAGNDLFMVVDSSARESKKISITDVITYFEATGSFNAVFATSAGSATSASHVPGSGVDGTVLSSSFATKAYTASLAQRATNADTASYALTASFVSGLSQVSTASFLLYSGVPNGTASFALTASRVALAQTSSFLIYTGISNGTSSYSISSSTSLFAVSASVLTNNNFTSSFSVTSSFSNQGLSSSYASNGIVDYVSVLSKTVQVGTGGTISSPFPVSGLEAKMLPKSVNSNFLIVLSTSIANGTGGGFASVALWKSSSFEVVRLNGTYAHASLGDGDLVSMTTTFIDKPQYDPGTPVTYSAQIYNAVGGGPWYVNRDRNNDRFATSSLSVMEFVL